MRIYGVDFTSAPRRAKPITVAPLAVIATDRFALGALRLAIRVSFDDQRASLIEEGGADRLDAVLCGVQAAWAWQRHMAGDDRYGLPPNIDPVEGWIVGAGWPFRIDPQA